MIVALFETLVVLVAAVAVVYATYALVMGADQRRRSSGQTRGRWEAGHFAVKDFTHVVVRKTVPGDGRVLDEHVIAVIPDGAADYETKFLEAMAQARARAALFESED
jgi:pyridoxamine 5'-phosphate oxidase family protein